MRRTCKRMSWTREDLLEEVVNDAHGLALLNDWIGEGGNCVGEELANKRSKICETCPQNVAPGWWDAHVKEPIAEVIRGELELKNKILLRVKNEKSIHMCASCGCCLPLKVWAPIKHIQEHTSDPSMLQFDNRCWIPKEIKELQ
jgi:hypothetical protein